MQFDEQYPLDSIPLGSNYSATKSSLCKQRDFQTEAYKYWCGMIKEVPRFHRKQWEFVYILESLKQRGMLAPGRKGLGFAVGREPLSATFASFGCQVLATDLNADSEIAKGWASNAQWCSGLEVINDRHICDDAAFRTLAGYRPVDMNNIPADLVGFDFNWSSCSFEHLGSIELGLRFLKNQLNTLKPGGWGIHTTEFNISSNDDTMEEPGCVIFRQRDIDKIVTELRMAGHFVEELDYSIGWFPLDYKVDLPPYCAAPHLRLQLQNYVCTSIGLIIRKKF